MTDQPPPILGYARPGTAKRRTWSARPLTIVLGVLQCLLTVLVVALPPIDFRPPQSNAPVYLRGARYVLDGLPLPCAYGIGSLVITVAAAIGPVPLRARLYRLHIVGWIVMLAVTEISVFALEQWPGERTHRWVLEHNLSTGAGPDGTVWTYLLTFIFCSPAALLCVASHFDELIGKRRALS